MRIFSLIFIAIIVCLNFDSAAFCTDDDSIDASRRTNEAAALINQSMQLKADDKLQESRSILEKACLLDPNLNSFSVHENLGSTLQALGELKAACLEFNKALQLAPDQPIALYNLANCYSQLGEIGQAISNLQSFLSKYPNNERADIVKKMLSSLQNTPSLKDNPSANDYLTGAVNTNTGNKLARWSSDKQPIKVYIESGKGINGYQPQFEEALKNAFDQWVSVINPRLSWDIVYKKGRANIICHWSSDRKNFEQPNSAELGETRLKLWLEPKHNDCDIIKANIIICTINIEGTSALTEEQMKNLCLHEVGHALGIQGHSSNHNDVMFLITKEHGTTQLSERDKTTLAQLYFGYPIPAYQNTSQNQYSNNYQNTKPYSYTGNNSTREEPF